MGQRIEEKWKRSKMYINEFEEVRKERKGKQVNQQKKRVIKKKEKRKNRVVCACVFLCASRMYILYL